MAYLKGIIATTPLRYKERSVAIGGRLWVPAIEAARLVAAGQATLDTSGDPAPNEIDTVAELADTLNQMRPPRGSGVVTPSNTALLPPNRGLRCTADGTLVASLIRDPDTAVVYGAHAAGDEVTGEFARVFVDNGAGTSTSGTWIYLE